MASSKKMNPSPSAVFQQQFDSIRPDLFLPETEETWDRIARGLAALTTACDDMNMNMYTPPDLVVVIRSISRPLISAMNSERGRLSGVAIDLVAVVASSLGVAFDPLLSPFFPVLLAMSSRTSKVTVARARTCILTIIEATHLPSILSYLMQSVADKSVSLRQTIVESTLACMNCFNPPDLEKDPRAKDIEAIIRATARDANAEVRKVSKKVFEAYKLLLPSRLESFTTPLTPTTRKYLDIQSKVNDKLKPSHPHPSAHPKAVLLSSSTSAVRGPSSRRPPTHTRSASSPAIGPEAVASGANGDRPTRSHQVDMAPPRLPEPIQSSGHAVAVRSTSVIDRKPVVSMSAAVRPGIPHTKPERGRPNPAVNHPVRRPQPVDEGHRTTQTTAVVARRVPVSEVQTKLNDKGMRTPRTDNSVSTPAIRHVSAAVAPPAVAPKPSVPKAAPNKDGVHTRATGRSKSKEPTKQRSLTQPTLSQLARAKAIERRVTVPTVPKLSRGKTAPPRKPPVSTSTEDQSAPTVTVTPAPDETTPNSPNTLSGVVEPEPEHVAATDTEEISSAPPELPPSEASDAEEQSDETLGTENLPGPSKLAGLTTPPRVEPNIDAAANKTPISELLLSIERGFLFTPSAPLSPPDSYLSLGPPANLAIPFPLRTMWGEQDKESEEAANKVIEGIRHLESRRALGDVAINK
ncbi:clasp N terminal-domain-containing protein [Mycena maculata]|uniref:Clasp N terminal-domain-containing protein n=1 Tax=Mycena maculata TaxID=230809 RepID=A0AAD7MEP5_9AGAR|nr:clasp N terminal-domain-containing protein [Mycena maculata]